MTKGKGYTKRIVGIVLAAVMVITLIPQMEYTGAGVTVDAYPIYNKEVYEQVASMAKNTAYGTTSTVYAGITPWFFLTDSTSATLKKSHFYGSTVTNLRPAIGVVSSDDKSSYSATFRAENRYCIDIDPITSNEDVFLLFGANFVSSKKNRPSMSLNGTIIGGDDLEKNKTMALSGKTKWPYNNLNLKVWGASKTEVNSMWVVARDDTSPEYEGISIDQKSDGLYFTISMDEDLRWANSKADNYIEQMYLEFDVADGDTGIEIGTIKADFYETSDNTITFRCPTDSMQVGEGNQKTDLTASKFSVLNVNVTIPVITGIDFSVYGVLGCYNYRSGYIPSEKRDIISILGCAITHLKDVQIDTTPITDLAGNKLVIGNHNLIGENNKPIFVFDNEHPTITEITISNANLNVSETATDMNGKTEDSWPEDINRDELFLGKDEQAVFSVYMSETIDTSNSPKLKLNVLDANGKQIELSVKQYEQSIGTYGEGTKIIFNPFTVQEGMQMMSGYEGEPIQVLGISGTLQDTSGNGYVGGIPAPSQQQFLDVSAPQITVEQTTSGTRELVYTVKVADGTDDELPAGVLGQIAKMTFTTEALEALNYKCVVKDTAGTILQTQSGTMSQNNAATISWTLHGIKSYETTVTLTITNQEDITVDKVEAKVVVADIKGNESAWSQVASDSSNNTFTIDEVAPVILIKPMEYTQTATDASFTLPIQVTDHTGLQSLQYQWVDLGKEAVESDWQAIDITDTKNMEHTFIEKFTNTIEKTLWVKAEDTKGNEAAPIKRDVVIVIDRPEINYDATQIVSELDPAPVLTVAGPIAKSSNASSNANATGYTRVTVTMGENTYVTLVKTGETVNIFDFSGTWYQVTLNTDETGYKTVTELADTSVLKNYYGEVSVSFDAAYADLTPKAGETFAQNVTDSSYVTDEAEIKVLYAPVRETPSEAYNVTFGNVKDVTGETVIAENGSSETATVRLNQVAGEASVLAGTQFAFTVENLLKEDWTVSGIDYTKSYIQLNYIADAEAENSVVEVLDAQALQPAISQTYIVPDGLDYETGMYSITIYVYQKGGTDPAEYQSLNLVLDATTVENVGLWEWVIHPYTNWTNPYDQDIQDEIRYTAENEPFTSVSVTLGDETLTASNALFKYYTAGASTVELRLQCDEYASTYGGITVGKVVGFRLWNSLSGISEEALAADNFVQTSTENNRVEYYHNAGITVYEKEAMGSTSFVTTDTKLPVVYGVNTFYYQVKLENGTITEPRAFTIYVSDVMPVLDITLDSYEASLKQPEDAEALSVRSITLKYNGAYSMNTDENLQVSFGTRMDADITHADGTTEAFNPSENNYQTYFYQLQEGDCLTFNDDYDNTYSEDSFSIKGTPDYGFLVYDSYGGAMVVAPQIGCEGSPYTIDETNYKITPFDNSIVYSAYKGPIVENILLIQNNSNYVAIPELVNYDTISFTFTYEEDGETKEFTAPMVDNYAEPNPAGYMGAVRENDQIIVYIANPIGEDAESEFVRYTVNYEDVYGNPLSQVAGYNSTPYTGDVYTEEMCEDGVAVLVNAAVAGGIDAQYHRSNGYYGKVPTGEFLTGKTFTGTYTDMFGKVHEISHTIEYGWNLNVEVEISETEPTFNDVEIKLSHPDGLPIAVYEREGLTITGNGTSNVTIVVSENGYVSFSVTSGEDVQEEFLSVYNIVDFEPMILWDYDESEIQTDPITGKTYINRPITAYIVDANEYSDVEVLDAYTNRMPSYTFYPDDVTSYTFKGEDYYGVLGEKKIQGTDILVELPVDELRNETMEAPDSIPEADTVAPAVQLRSYAKRNGYYQKEAAALQVEPDINVGIMTDYEGDTVFECFDTCADTTAFLEAIGWATTYRFELEAVDNGDVKFYVKQGLFDSVPVYPIVGSDTIEGVTLNGRVLEVSKSTQFTLFAVDEAGNTTVIPFNIDNVGEALIPEVSTVYAGTKAYTYIYPLEADVDDISDFTISVPTGTNAVVKEETDKENAYFGKWYVEFEENKTYTINYSYTYRGEQVTGSIEVEIDEIDDVQIQLQSREWSHNKEAELTNQDVSVTLEFNKAVKNIVVPYGYQDCVDVLIVGSRVTLRYSENLSDELSIIAVAYNDTQTTIAFLGEITNIDKIAPSVSEPTITLASDGKSAEVRFEVDEEALLRETNNYGSRVDGMYVHTKTIKENGIYTYHFIDKAGNIAEKIFEVNTIVDTPLKLYFNTSATDTGAQESADKMSLKVGDTLYVKANRACEISLNKGEAQQVAANTWVAFTITNNEAGLCPIIYAVDAYGNTATGLLEKVPALDVKAPVISLKKEQITVKVGVSREEVLALLKANVTILGETETITPVISFTDRVDVEGVTRVTYQATDAAGNISIKTGTLRITPAAEPDVTIDGTKVERDSIYLGEISDALKLSVDTDGEPYSVVYKKGVFTTAQMKIGATTLVRDAETVSELSLPLEEEGYYTICIRTQGRDEYLFIVYVE